MVLTMRCLGSAPDGELCARTSYVRVPNGGLREVLLPSPCQSYAISIQEYIGTDLPYLQLAVACPQTHNGLGSRVHCTSCVCVPDVGFREVMDDCHHHLSRTLYMFNCSSVRDFPSQIAVLGR